MINNLKDDVKNASEVAIKAAGDTVSQLNKIYDYKKNITPNMQDQIEDIQFSIPKRYLQYWKTFLLIQDMKIKKLVSQYLEHQMKMNLKIL